MEGVLPEACRLISLRTNRNGLHSMRRLAMPAALLCVTANVAANVAALAAEPAPVAFQTHASFFSAETRQPKPIDPQVFVQDGAAAPGIGPQGIHHVSGVRPALIGSDPPGTHLVNAQNKPLNFTLGQWLGAGGDVTLTGSTVAATFHGLRSNAHYSLFENHFDQSPAGFTPLDGKGVANGFKTNARGEAAVTVTAPAPLTRDNAVLVILDDDGEGHGASRGEVGISAQHQLIARPPG